MAFETRTRGQQPTTSMSATIPEIINWPVQKRKMWHGEGRLPPWIEVRRVVNGAIEEGLNIYSVDELLNIVKEPSREAGLKAARNKRDKDSQLKREYYNMVMDLLWEAHLRQSERRRVRADFARDLTDITLVDRDHFYGEEVDRTNRVNTTSGRATQQPKAPLNGALTEGHAKQPTIKIEDLHGEDQQQSYVEVKTPNSSVTDVPQNTGFYASFFNSLFIPSILQGPVPEMDDGLWASEDEWSEVASRRTEGPRPSLAEENPDDSFEEWVDVGRELDLQEGMTYRGSALK